MRMRVLEMPAIASDYIRAAWLSSRRRAWMIPRAVLRVCISRARHGIGPRFYTLFEFDQVSQGRWGDYLLDEGLRPILRTINHERVRDVVNCKVRFHDHCLKNNLATVPILLKFGTDKASEFCPTSFQEIWAALQTQEKSATTDAFFCKRVSGSWGQGSFGFKRVKGQWLYGDDVKGPPPLLQLCKQDVVGTSSEWIIQPLMSVHKSLTEITSPHGLSTVRIISVLDEGKVILLAAMFRITVGANVIDNFSAGQTGNLVASINLETGCLGQCKGSVSREFPMVAVFERHPDTGKRIAGFSMPYWEELKDLVVRAHQSLPQLVALAWDIAVTDEGPVIVEANPTFDVSGMQVAHGKGLGPMLFGHLRRLRPEVF